MALAEYVVTAKVTVTPDVAATITAGEPCTGPLFGSEPTATPGTAGKFGLWGATFLPGMVVMADSPAGSTGPQLLYQAIGAGNLRAFVDFRRQRR